MTIKFGTDGWRAQIARDFTFSNVNIVSRAIGHYILAHDLGERGVVVGYDNRFLSGDFASDATKTLSGMGIRVLPTEHATPTPVVAFAVKRWSAGGAIMITASHNPPTDNGIKFIPEYAGPAFAEITREIEGYIQQLSQRGELSPSHYSRRSGPIEPIDPKPSYLDHLQDLIDFALLRESRNRVGVDPMHGAGAGYIEEALQRAGWYVRVIHNRRDPLFGGRLPDPSEYNLLELKRLVRRGHLALGLAMDGDADRMGVIDRDGTFYTPNQVLVLFLQHLVRRRGLHGPVARTVATTSLLDEVAAREGLETIETPVGFKYMADALMNKGAIMGGEESGGFSMRGHVPEKDGILANMLVIEMLAATGKSLAELWDEIIEEHGPRYSQRLDLKFSPGNRQAILDKVRSLQFQREVAETTTIDGYKFIFADGSWCLIRPSGTEDILRVYVESRDRAWLEELVHYIPLYLGLIGPVNDYTARMAALKR